MPVHAQPLTRRRLAWLLAGLILLLGLLLWHYIYREPPGPRLETLSGRSMGTTYEIKISGEVPDAASLDASIRALIDDLDGKMSTYDEESEVSRFNRSDSTKPFPISSETTKVVAAALEISEETAGAFDITLGPLVNAYGFGSETRVGLPTDDELTLLSHRIGYQHLTLDEHASTLRKAQPDVAIDLSALAKGFAVDEVARVLDERGLENYFIEIGGEIRARGVNAEGRVWTAGIEAPIANRREIYRIAPVRDAAIATSGDYRNFYEVGGRRISHTLDGRTGKPAVHNLASVTIVHGECMWADGYATAVMALGPEDGRILLEILDLPGLLLIREDDGSFAESATPAWEARFGTDATAPELSQ